MQEENKMPEPKIQTMPIIHQRVHGFVAWSALISMAYVALMPMLAFAQIGTFPGEAPPQPPPFNDVNFCAQKCADQNKQCLTTAGDNKDAQEKCGAIARECNTQCQATLSNPNPAPASPPQPQTGNDCGQKCGAPAKDCMTQAGDNQDARNKCIAAYKECSAQCQPQGFGGQQGPGGKEGFGNGQRGGEQGPQCQLERVKKQMGQGFRQITALKKRIATYEKKGVKIPQALTDAIASIEDLMQKVQGAKDCQEIIDLEPGNVLQDAGQTIRDELPKLERLASLSKIYARIDRQLATFDKQLASDKALAAKSKVDLSAAVNTFEDELNKLKQAYADAKDKIDSGDVETGFDDLQNDVFDAIGNVAQAHAAVQQLRRLQSTLNQINSEIRRDQSQLDRLKKAGKDTADAQSILDEGKAKLDELKAAVSAQPIDTSAISDILDQMTDIRDRFTQALNDLKGVQAEDTLDQGLSIPTFQVPNLGL